MAFPSNPNNGDTYIRYGRTYEYDSTMSMWKVKQSGIQLNELSDVDVDTTTPSVGDTLVWSGTKFVPDEINLLSVYQSELPLAGNVAGQMAYVTDTSRLYIYTGAGWFNVALVNTNPTITVGPDGGYAFATDGTPIVLTLEAQDPEELPIAWSYVVTSGVLGSTATVHQEGNVFTITPSTDENDAGEFSITFTASDGVNLATAVSSFTLSFGTDEQYYNKNSLLLKSGSTAGLNNHTFVDESTNSHTVTRIGDVYQGSLSPYSPAGWSVYFDGTGDRVDMPGADFSGDFTMEEWVYWPSRFTGNRLIATNRGGIAIAGPGQWWIDEYNNAIRFYFDDGARIDISETFPKDQWFHWAITRAGSTVRVFINGVQKGTATTTNDLGTAAREIKLGGFTDNTAYSFGGYQSNFRTVEGTALYTSNFTPPTEPLTAISGTSLLTCQSNRFIDNSTNNFTITKTGDTKPVPFSPHLPSEKYDPTVHGGSAYFDGSGDYLTANITPVSNLGATTYTIEGWVWINSNGNRALIGAASTKYYIQWNNTTFFIGDGSANITASWTPLYNRWLHIAVSRDSGGTTRAFIDGSLLLTSSTTLSTGSLSYLEIGRKGSTAYIMDGYISNVRYVAGTALYTSEFTPPTEPLTAVSGTELLLNMNNAGIYDEVGKNYIKMVGNTTTSTTQTKYSDTSVYFDGAADWIDLYSENLILSSAFTIEAWVFLSSSQGNQTLVNMAPPHNNLGISLNRGGTGSTHVYIGNGTSWTGVPAINSGGGNTIAINQWYHVALTSDGTTLRLFHNGIIVGTSTTLPSGFQGYARIGAIDTGSASEYFNGYMEDFRITNGVARYTANFTPPTAALGFSNAE
jgi:hypothetical protein